MRGVPDTADKREDIIEAAIDIVAEKGLTNFSAKDVTVRAECSSALIYKYFKSNEMLFKSCGDTIQERHKRFANEILEEVDFSGEYWEVNERIFYLYFKKYSGKKNDCLFVHALAGTKYDEIVAELDDRSNDPLFSKLFGTLDVKDETLMTDLLVTYDCTRIALNVLLNTIAGGYVPDTDEEYHALAKMLVNGIGYCAEKSE